MRNQTQAGIVAVLKVAEADAESLLAAPPHLVDFLPVGVYVCDSAGRVIWFNARAAELWGRTPETGEQAELFCGSHRLYGLDGGLVSRSETPMAYCLRTGEAVEGRVAVVERPDGSRITAMVHIAPLRSGDGALIGAVNCFHDVSELVGEDGAARASERQLRDILNALPAAVYTTDAAGRISFYNDAAVEMSGRRPELGRDEWCVTWKLFTPDGAPLRHEDCPMAVALREDREIRGIEAVAERPDGTRVPFLPYPTPLHDEAGQLVGAVNMLVDISHRKDAETQQRLLFAELNHRIKNNMQMLHALLSTARRETQSEEAREALGEAAGRVASMAAAQTVLYRSNKLSRFSARAFMRSVCEAAAAACGPRLELEHSAPDRELGNDTAAPLALILNELLTNAAKHAAGPDGRARVRVALEESDGLFSLIVADEGPGFDLTEVRRRSSGLGLVAGLARQIGGSFAVECDRGARCIVRFRDQGCGQG